ncbi:MAG: amidohydrolase family protein [Solirubrobacterales bacterium]
MNPTRVVDAHSHFIPANLVARLRQGSGPTGSRIEVRAGVEWLVHSARLAYPLAPYFWDLEARLESMDEDGIDAAVVSIAPPLFLYSLPAPEASEYCAAVNSAAAALVADAPDRLRALATLPMSDPTSAAAELRAAVGELGLAGAEIGTSVGSLQLDHPRLAPVWEAAEELGVPVMLHPHRAMVEGPPAGMERYYLANVVGNPVETTVAASRLLLGGVFDRYPGLRVLLVHGGGFLPYQLGRLSHAYAEAPDVAADARRPPGKYLENLLIDTVLFDEDALDFALRLVGEERVVFGTDQPFDMADRTTLPALRDSGLDRAAILAGNALRSFAPDGLS